MNLFIVFGYVLIITSWTLKNNYCLSTSIVSSGIPFNFPLMQYCGTCDLSNVWEENPKGEIDELCKEYTFWMSSGRWSMYRCMQDFLEKVKLKQPQYYWLFFAAWQAKQYFEDLFHGHKYTYRVYVEHNSNPQAENCLHVYTEGEGLPYTYNSSIRDKSLWRSGIFWQNMFTNGVRDLWATWECFFHDGAYHQEFISAAKQRMTNYRKVANTAPMFLSSWSQESITYDQVYLPLCLGNGASNHSSTLDVPQSKKWMDLYCTPPGLLSETNADTANAEISGQSSANPTCSSNSANPSRPLCHAGTSKFTNEGEEASSSFIIHEILSYPTLSQYPPEFIEIKATNPNEKNLRGVKIIAFTAQSKILIFVGNLNNELFDSKGFYVITPVKFQDERTKGYFQIAASDKGHKFLPDGKEENIVVMLLKREFRSNNIPQHEWDAIRLIGGDRNIANDMTKPYKIVKGKNRGQIVNILDVIKSTVVDAQVYGDRLNDELSYLQEIIPGVSGCNYVLTEDKEDHQVKHSLSYCGLEGVLKPFKSKYFKLATPTMGEENDCLTFIDFITSKLKHKPETRGLDETVGDTDNPFSEEECPSHDNRYGELTLEIDREIEFIRQNYNKEYNIDIYPEDKFTTILDDTIFKSTFSIDDQNEESVFGPFEVVHNSRIRSGKTIKCRICNARHRNAPHTFKGQEIDDFVKDDGHFSTSLRWFKYRVRKHLRNPIHLYSILKKVRNDKFYYAAESGKRFITKTDSSKGLGIEKLSHHFQAVFTLVKMNTAPSNFPILMKLISVAGGKVGPYMVSKYTAFKMIKFLGDEAHSIIIQYMIKHRYPVSIILDGSSDTQSKHNILVYLQTQEGTRVVVYFYKLLKLGKSSTAESYLEAIKAAIKEDGEEFEKYFLTNLVAVITDSENTMKKLHELFDQWVDRRTFDGKKIELFKVFCLAHKTSLITKTSFLPGKKDKDLGPDNVLLFFSKFESILTHFHTWLRIALRRMGEFREVQTAFRMPRIELVKFFPNRWISSEDRAIRNFLIAYPTTVKTMWTISHDTFSYKKDAIEEAKRLHTTLSDKRFLIILIYLQDYTFSFKIWSKLLQQSGALLIDQYEPMQRVKRDLAVIDKFNGDILTGFLRSIQCFRDNEWKLCESVVDYEGSEKVVWKGMTFMTTEQEFPLLSVLGPALIKKTNSKFKVYLPEEDIDALKILRPTHFPSSVEALETQYPKVYTQSHIRIYGSEQLDRLSSTLGLNPIDLKRDWVELVHSIVKHSKWSTYRNVHQTSEFWGVLLNDKKLAWSPLTELFIRKLLTVTSGSVSCESGFSFFNNIKTQRRISISNDHIQAIMRILLHGPKDFEDFDAFRYAKLWVESGMYTPDMTTSFTDSYNEQKQNTDGYDGEFIELEPGDDESIFDEVAATESQDTDENNDENVVSKTNLNDIPTRTMLF